MNMSSSNQNGWFGGGQQPTVAVDQPMGEQQLSTVGDQQQPASGPGAGDRATSTLKRNTKVEFTRSDLLQLLSYYEGEFQARDVAIAALKCEKLREAATAGRYRPVVLNEPYTALLRDMFADSPGSKPPYTDKDISLLADRQLEALERLVAQQRRAQLHMVNIIREAESKHERVVRELEEEKCKHEHDTAQGDDITYGLEMERTRLKQELELERQARRKLDKELKRQLELADEEKQRQKQIVLLLLAERKKIILKYVEERKRSEDLAQILSEEKARIDAMAEGLEEESKKSLQMEAELEKQAAAFEIERRQLQTRATEQDRRFRDLEAELRKVRAEADTLRQREQQQQQQQPPPPSGASSTSSSVAKVVQPTATVSSVPVTGPTTGIAQSVRGPGVASGRPAVRATAPTGVATAVVSPAPGTGKKAAALGRGLPPPIPPNKPVITAGGKQSGPPRRSDPQPPPDDKKPPPRPPATSPPGKEHDPLGQELADFQQMFVTMATGPN